MTQQEIISSIKIAGTALDKRKKNITPQVEETIKSMYRSNIRKIDIVRTLGVSYSTVDRVLDPKRREQDKATALKCTKARQMSLPKSVMYERRKEAYKRHLAYKTELLNNKLNTLEV